MLIKQIYQKNVIFVTIGILKISVLNISLIFVKAEVIKTNFLGNDMPKKICMILALLAKTIHKFI